MKRKPTKSILKRKADKLLSLKVREIGKCQKCGKRENLQAAHVITRANLRLRYDENNLMVLCSGCHLWWHREMLEAVSWFSTQFPKQYVYLMKAKNEIRKMTVLDYQEIIKSLS